MSYNRLYKDNQNEVAFIQEKGSLVNLVVWGLDKCRCQDMESQKPQNIVIKLVPGIYMSCHNIGRFVNFHFILE